MAGKKSILSEIQNVKIGKDETLENNSIEKSIKTAGNKPVRKQVDPHELMPNCLNTFSMEEDEEWHLLAKSITSDGINNDIIVYENPDPKSEKPYVVVSGHRRLSIAIEAGENRVPIKIIPPFNDVSEELIFIITENKSVRKQSPLDLGLSIKRLEEEMAKKEKESGEEAVGRRRDRIAEILGMSSRTVHNYSALGSLPPSCQDWLRKEYISIRQALILSTLPKDTLDGIVLQVDIAKSEKGYSVEELKAFIKKLLKEAQNTQKPAPKAETPRQLSRSTKNTLKKANTALEIIINSSTRLPVKESEDLLAKIDEMSDTLMRLRDKINRR